MQRSVAVSIEARLLPGRALVDTGVLIRALGDRRSDPSAPISKAFFQAMLDHRREVLIAAPSVAELLRGTTKTPVPRVQSISIVAFDGRAAEVLAERLPEDVLVKVRGVTKQPPIAYFKYDALIVACAIRHGAEVIVSLDPGMLRLAEQARISAKHPQDFVDPQGKLPLPL